MSMTSALPSGGGSPGVDPGGVNRPAGFNGSVPPGALQLGLAGQPGGVGVNPGGPDQPVGAGSDPASQNADAIIQNLLAQYGLGSLAGWAWNLVTQGLDANAIQAQLYQRPEFKARFPGIGMRTQKGLPPVSPGDYVNYENQAVSLFRQYGLPSGFYDTTDHLANFIGNDVSLAEVGQRVQDYSQAAYQSQPEVINQLQQLYGVTSGELTAFFLDPQMAMPLIQKRWNAAQLSGQAQISGYGTQLNVGQAEMLADQGVTQTQAQTGFARLGLEQQLFSPLPGQYGQQGLGTDVQLGAEFLGNAADQRAVQMEGLRRQAAFQGGGSFAGGPHGLTGLGTEQGAQAS